MKKSVTEAPTPKDIVNRAEETSNSFLGTAQSFIKDAKENTVDIVDEGTKYLKKESKKNLRKAEGYMKQHPRKGFAYAVGLGAVLAYFFIPRGK